MTDTTDAAARLARIERAFGAALARLASAETYGDAEDELSNALHHLYRLSELAPTSGAKDTSVSDATRVLLALRGADTHAISRISQGAFRLPLTVPIRFNVPVFELVEDKGIADPELRQHFEVSVRGQAADRLLPQAFTELKKRMAFS